jgi:hypothetical protein
MRDRDEVIARLHEVIALRREWEALRLPWSQIERGITAEQREREGQIADEILRCSVEISALRWALGEDDGELAVRARKPEA